MMTHYIQRDDASVLLRSLPTWLTTILLVFIVVGGGGCVLPPTTTPTTQVTAGSGVGATPGQPRNLVNGLPEEYIIGVSDVLEILVWRNDSLSRIVTVRPDGKISLPLVNDVQAAGLTPMQLKDQIAKKLRKFKEIPEVSVIVNQTNSQVIYLMGQVARPGPYPLGPNAAILQVIAQAGGFTAFADRNNILVIRKSAAGGKEQRIRVSYKSILAGRSSKGNVALQAGDTIIVP